MSTRHSLGQPAAERARAEMAPAGGRPGRTRIAALDLLRGYFLLVILIDHAQRFPGLYDIFTGRGWLWVSAAEGFFITSGIMAGMVRGREFREGRPASGAKKLLKRASVLYAWSVSLTFFFTYVGTLLAGHAGIKYGLSVMSLPDLIWKTLTLQYVYGWADFLVYYAVYMAFAPIVLWLVSRRLAWIPALVSVGIWLERGTNFFYAWQILFVGGLIAGYYLRDMEAFWSTWDRQKRRVTTLAVGGLTAVTLVASIFIILVKSGLNDHANFGIAALIPLRHVLNDLAGITGPWFDKWSLAPGRAILAAVWFVTLYAVVRRYEDRIARAVGWLLLPLGRNSLYVYGFESFILFGQALLLPGGPNLGLIANIAINTVLIVLVWLSTTVWVKGHAWLGSRRLRNVGELESSRGGGNRVGRETTS